MGLYSSPPEMSSFFDDKPTLLVCWWVTIFCTTIILIRVAGRLVRTEHLFSEDTISFCALIPLYARMACIHCVLLYGTNNANFTGEILTETQLRHKQLASGLVLAARVFFAATLWVLKLSTLEFLKRLTDSTWERSYANTIMYARISLAITFVAVIISNFVECQPFSHYWQVLPDPGGRCRQSFAHLVTMGLCNIVTDLMLAIIPIPIIVRSTMSLKRKSQLILLFSLNLSVVAISIARVHNIIAKHGDQQYRSLMASVELLFAVAAANSLVLGSFVRDRGVKKHKFKFNGDGFSSDPHSTSGITGPRQPLYKHQWGSDEDLVQGLGLSVKPELRLDTKFADTKDQHPHFTPAPIMPSALFEHRNAADDWNAPFHSHQHSRTDHSEDSLITRDHLHDQIQGQIHGSSASASGLSPRSQVHLQRGHSNTPSVASSHIVSPAQAAAIMAAASTPLTSKGQVSFFDLGGLLENGGPQSPLEVDEDVSSFRHESYTPTTQPLTLAQQQNQSYWAYQSAMLAAPMPTAMLVVPQPTANPEGVGPSNKASTTILQDLSGLLSPVNPGVAGPSTGTTTVITGGEASKAPAHGHQKSKSSVQRLLSQYNPGGSPAKGPDEGPGFADLGGLLK
ncbi:hypothetical protein TD95_003197 [Thielaviopsis punctulata]|uniref:Rhodopsin domain-containing protein n=1 Tax=Thielaviopsis punctulata TaxID=72032 RepID=A0A0F4ZAN2_9PEZI|nr:hypothetical protein TD95_003197 [Thielaviopsis punctulata]